MNIGVCKKYLGVAVLSFQLFFPTMALLSSPAQTVPATDKPVSVKTAWSVDRARPGDTLALAVVLDIKDGFHINADAGQIQPFKDFTPYPTKIQVMAATDGVTIAGSGRSQW